MAADLDGTLLDAAGAPVPGVAAALLQLQAAGVAVVVCTGRPTAYALRKAERLGLGAGPAIAYGGAETVSLDDGRALRRVLLSHDLGAAVHRVSAGLGLQVEAHEAPGGVLRLVVTGEPERVERAAVTLSGEYGDGVSLWRPPGALVVQSGAATKLHALAALAADLGIAPSRVAYAGDAADDAPAWGWAGFGIAVGAPHARDAAVASVAPDGLVELLLRLSLARRLRPPDGA